MTIPKPVRSNCPYLYKYSSPEHLEWLRVTILEHELYLPNLKELNDPADGRPKLALQSEDEMASFFYEQFIRLHPGLTPAEQKREAEIISFNVKLHTPAGLQPMMVEALDTELQDYRIYSLTKRYDNMSLWAKYAADHRGYCLEFANAGLLFEKAKDVSYLEPTQMEILITDQAVKNGDFFFCKHLDWRNEEEARLVLPRGKGSKVKIDPRWLTRAILGKDMSEPNRKVILEWAKQRQPELAVVSAYFDPVYRMIKLAE
ncbi:MAG: DUF2971 domain-containing protein [Candidatus Acidiferrales bacterium]